MPKQRKPGDIIWKKPMAGFSAQPGLGMIPPGSKPEEVACLDCDDPSCREWPDVWALGPDGKPNGDVWCHVTECQMEDIEDAER